MSESEQTKEIAELTAYVSRGETPAPYRLWHHLCQMSTRLDALEAKVEPTCKHEGAFQYSDLDKAICLECGKEFETFRHHPAPSPPRRTVTREQVMQIARQARYAANAEYAALDSLEQFAKLCGITIIDPLPPAPSET